MVRPVLLIGSGSIGRRHLANLRHAVPGAAVTLLRRPGAGSLDPAVAAAVDRVADHMDDALQPLPELAVVAGPASTHVAHALALADAGVPMLIEKPLSVDLAGCHELAAICRANAVPVVVGYTLRHHPGFIELRGCSAPARSAARCSSAPRSASTSLTGGPRSTTGRRSPRAGRSAAGPCWSSATSWTSPGRSLACPSPSAPISPESVTSRSIPRTRPISSFAMHPADRSTGGVEHPPRHPPAAAPAQLRLTGTEGTLQLDLAAGTSSDRNGWQRLRRPVPRPSRTGTSSTVAELADLLAAMDGRTPRVGLEDGIATMQIIDAPGGRMRPGSRSDSGRPRDAGAGRRLHLRQGRSKGLPGKNIRPLAGVPLIGHAIQAALATPRVARCVVSTDDPEIAAVSRALGAETPFIRPAELATDTASEWLAWRHAISTLRDQGRPWGRSCPSPRQLRCGRRTTSRHASPRSMTGMPTS